MNRTRLIGAMSLIAVIALIFIFWRSEPARPPVVGEPHSGQVSGGAHLQDSQSATELVAGDQKTESRREEVHILQSIEADVLQSKGSISGVVLDSNGAVVQHATILTMLALDPEELLDLEQLSDSDSRGYSEQNGEFHLPRLAPGRYALGVKRGFGLPLAAHSTVTVDRSEVHVQLQLSPPDSNRSIRVRTFDSHGERMTQVEYLLEFEMTERAAGGEENTAIHQFEVVNYPQGDCDLLLFDEHQAASYFGSDSADDRFTIFAVHADLGQIFAPLEPAQFEVDLHYETPAELRLQIEGYQASGLRDRIQIYLEKTDGQAVEMTTSEGSHVTIHESGECLFSNLQQGDYRLILATQLEGVAKSLWQLAERDLTLKSGANHAHVRLPKLSELQVTWPSATKDDWLYLVRELEQESWFNTIAAKREPDNLFSFSLLPDGEYQLTSKNHPDLKRSVSVPCKDFILSLR